MSIPVPCNDALHASPPQTGTRHEREVTFALGWESTTRGKRTRLQQQSSGRGGHNVWPPHSEEESGLHTATAPSDRSRLEDCKFL